MAYRNLDEYLIRLEQSSELATITPEVAPDLEIAAITQRVAHLTERRNCALWFAQVAGSDFPVVTNLFGTERRAAWALNVETLDDLTAKLGTLLDLSLPQSFSELINRGGLLMSALRSAGVGVARTHNSSFAREVTVAQPDLQRLPFLRMDQDDTHFWLTRVQVLTVNAGTATRNLINGRVARLDATTLGIPRDLLPDSAAPEAAIVLGSDPAALWCGDVPLPGHLDPYLLAGWLRSKHVPMTPGVTVPFDVPADAEMVIEGTLDLAHDGDLIPMRVTSLTHRRDAVIPVYVPGTEPYARTAIERLFLPVLRIMLEDVVDIHSLPDNPGVVIAAVRGDRGQVQRALFGMWGLGHLALAHTLLLVDAATDPRDTGAVAAALVDNVIWSQDVTLVEGLRYSTNGSAPHTIYGPKLGIDATRAPSIMSTTPIDAQALDSRAPGRWWRYGADTIAAVTDDPDSLLPACRGAALVRVAERPASITELAGAILHADHAQRDACTGTLVIDAHAPAAHDDFPAQVAQHVNELWRTFGI